MRDVPFGFGPSDRGDDPDRPERREEPQNPFGFGAMPGGGAFDVNQLGQMLTQLGQMLSQAQSSGGGPVNYELAAQMAHQQLAATTSSLTASQRAAVSDAVKLAELWLDAATDFPA